MALSGGKLDPATYHFLMWELPLSIGWQLFHASICNAGGKTQASGQSILEEHRRIKAQLAASKQQRRAIIQ